MNLSFQNNTLILKTDKNKELSKVFPQKIQNAILIKNLVVVLIWSGENDEAIENLRCFDIQLNEVWRKRTPYSEQGVSDDFRGLSIKDAKVYVGNFLGWEWELNPVTGELTNPVFHK